MAIDYQKLMALSHPEKSFAWGARETILYALGVGMGREADELAYVYEKGLKALPTLATVIAWDDTWQDATGMDLSKIVHGEMRVTLHKPLPAEGRVISAHRIAEAYDKGPGRGAVLLAETKLRDAADESPVATLLSTVFARGDGGFGGPEGRGPAPHVLPERVPDRTVMMATRPEQALFYRLSGDQNPLHADPDVAQAAGFERPILQGLCSYGMACASLVKALCPEAPERLTHIEARFTAPVYPGETLLTDLWDDGGRVSFRTHVAERGVVALDHGRADIATKET